jgi:hypothetical protein
VPLRLVASVSLEDWSALDLSGLRLTKLGIDCCGVQDLWRLTRSSQADFVWLWPERLPGTLEKLHLHGPAGDWLRELAWAPQSSAGLAGWLPRLHTLCVTCEEGGGPLGVGDLALLEGFPGLPNFRVTKGSGADTVVVHNSLFVRIGHVRIVAGGRVHLQGHQDDVVMLADRLCPAGLQAAELCAGGCISLSSGGLFLNEVVRTMIGRHGDRFAVEVGLAEDPDKGPGNERRLRRLAWHRWPAPPARPACRRPGRRTSAPAPGQLLSLSNG